MIQRIQSIWLLIAAVFAFLTIRFSFFSGNQNIGAAVTKTFVALNAASNFTLLLLTIAEAVAAIVVIFLYKDRKRQMMVTGAIAAVSIINIVLYFAESKHFIPGEGKLDLTAAFVFVIPVFLLLALRAIWKDEQLVKSADRLR